MPINARIQDIYLVLFGRPVDPPGIEIGLVDVGLFDDILGKDEESSRLFEVIDAEPQAITMRPEVEMPEFRPPKLTPYETVQQRFNKRKKKHWLQK